MSSEGSIISDKCDDVVLLNKLLSEGLVGGGVASVIGYDQLQVVAIEAAMSIDIGHPGFDALGYRPEDCAKWPAVFSDFSDGEVITRCAI